MGNATGAARNPAVYDVVVLGGGPAGAATAMHLARRGRTVLFAESTAYDAPRFGETLPPEANPLLRELGVWAEFERTQPAASPGIVSAWGSPAPYETHFLANRFGAGRHVDRNAFDALLARAAEVAGATFAAGTAFVRAAFDDGAGAWTLAFAGDRTERARFLVDATGRNGARIGESARTFDDRLLAIFLRIAFDGAAPRDARTLIESVPDGWWYCAPLPSGETAAVLFVDPGEYVDEGFVLGEQLAKAPLTHGRIGSGRIAASHTVNVPSSVREHIVGPHWAAVGDAAAAYDPLSGYGIVKALQDARAFVDAYAEESLDGYAAGVRRRFDAYVEQRRAYYALEQRWPERPFWQRRR